jgi:hypothetical protein
MQPHSAPVTRATCPQASHKTEIVYVPRRTEHVVERLAERQRDKAEDATT